jgi:hypothetical protein
MGWSGQFVGLDLDLKEIKMFMYNDLKSWGKGFGLLYMSFKFGTVYAAMESPEGEIFAVVQLWKYSKSRGEITTKTMTEHVGPCNFEAPMKLLKMLSPTDSEYAIEWRKSAWSQFKKIPKEYR